MEALAACFLHCQACSSYKNYIYYVCVPCIFLQYFKNLNKVSLKKKKHGHSKGNNKGNRNLINDVLLFDIFGWHAMNDRESNKIINCDGDILPQDLVSFHVYCLHFSSSHRSISKFAIFIKSFLTTRTRVMSSELL